MGSIIFLVIFGGCIVAAGGTVAFRHTQRGKAYEALHQLALQLGKTLLHRLPAGRQSGKYFVYQVVATSDQELRVAVRFRFGYLPAIIGIEESPLFKSYTQDEVVTRAFTFTIWRTAS